MPIKLLVNDLVAIKRNEDNTVTTGGIILTESEKDCEGTVVAVGPGRHFPDGKFIKTTVQIGDTVIFHKDAGEAIEVDNESYLIISEENIIGIIK